ncbi:MAG: Ig-like domain-containing protein, partial [Nitrospirota bacterium]
AVNKQTIFTIPASGVLANDSDVDGNTLTAAQRSNPSGTVSLNADGSFTYTTTAGYVGTRVFKYRANDGLLNSADVTVTLVKDLTVTSIASNNANTIWIIRGKSTKPNTTVTVYLGATTTGTVLGTATVGGNGTWRLDVSKATYPSLAPFISVKSSAGAELIEVPAP